MSTSAVFIPHEEFVWVSGEIINDVDSKGNVEVRYNDELLPHEQGSKIISIKNSGYPPFLNKILIYHYMVSRT